jgi:hypothetical protein
MSDEGRGSDEDALGIPPIERLSEGAKRELASDLRARGLSVRQIAKHLSVAHATAKAWCEEAVLEDAQEDANHGLLKANMSLVLKDGIGRCAVAYAKSCMPTERAIRITKPGGETEDRFESVRREGNPVHLTTQLQLIQVFMRLHGLGVEDAPNPQFDYSDLIIKLEARAEAEVKEWEEQRAKLQKLAIEAEQENNSDGTRESTPRS